MLYAATGLRIRSYSFRNTINTSASLTRFPLRTPEEYGAEAKIVGSVSYNGVIGSIFNARPNGDPHSVFSATPLL